MPDIMLISFRGAPLILVDCKGKLVNPLDILYDYSKKYSVDFALLTYSWINKLELEDVIE